MTSNPRPASFIGIRSMFLEFCKTLDSIFFRFPQSIAGRSALWPEWGDSFKFRPGIAVKYKTPLPNEDRGKKLTNMDPDGPVPPTSAQSATVLIVDDEPANLSLLGAVLRPEFHVRVANSGANALRAAASAPKPDLVLLDVMMPGIDGYAVLARLRAMPAASNIPVIFLTAMADDGDEEYGLQLGAADYITKPIKPSIVLARVRTQLEIKQARDWLKDKNSVLEAEVQRRMAENDLTQLVSIRALAHLAETRDPETGKHLLRTQNYMRTLATALMNHRRFSDFLNPNNIEHLVKSAPLHDIGKVGIPDGILHKPGPLTPAEWEIMKTHSRLGSTPSNRPKWIPSSPSPSWPSAGILPVGTTSAGTAAAIRTVWRANRSRSPLA
ncbi:MAG: response regulator [Propionivibrio sp.]